MPLRPLTSMEYDDEDSLDACCPMPMPCKPDYPYGLRITLTDKELEKLKIDHADAFVGGTFHGHFMARVTSVSADENSDRKSCRLEAQIEDLAIESEDEESTEGKGED